MNLMFQYCHGLISLNISSFDTSKVTNMRYLFQYCYSLKYLDLSNFNTSKVTNMEAMFLFCLSLETLNINNFDTSSVNNMKYMFSNCRALKSLDLSNFDTTSLNNMVEMFISINPYLTYCIDDKKEYKFLDQLKNYHKSCSEICISYNLKKYNPENNHCINNCTMDEIYKYEYNNICYENCPNNTKLSNDNYSCILIDIDDNITDNSDNKTNNTNNNIIYIIIGIGITFIIAIIVVIIIVIKKRNSIKITFNENQNLIEISTNPKKKVKDIIDIFFKKKKMKYEKNYGFLCNGTNINTKEEKRKEIGQFVSRFNKNKIIILVNDFKDNELSTVLIE
jgi:surface protein